MWASKEPLWLFCSVLISRNWLDDFSSFHQYSYYMVATWYSKMVLLNHSVSTSGPLNWLFLKIWLYFFTLKCYLITFLRFINIAFMGRVIPALAILFVWLNHFNGYLRGPRGTHLSPKSNNSDFR